MKVTYELRFPIVHPVTGIHTWHTARVAVPGLDLPAETIHKVVADLIDLNQTGGIGTMLRLAEHLRCLADKTMNPDYAGDGVEASYSAPAALIEWGGNYNTPLLGTDVTVTINFGDHLVYAGQDYAFDDFCAYGAEFTDSLEASAARAAGDLRRV